MIWSAALEIRCSQDTLFWLATYLVTQDGGDGDCTVICDVPRRLAARYDDSNIKPSFWKRDNLSFGVDQEWLAFIEDDEFSEKYGYSWVIKYLGDLPKCKKK